MRPLPASRPASRIRVATSSGIARPPKRFVSRRLAMARNVSIQPDSLPEVTDQATVSLLRWLRRQLRQPTPLREHLEAAVENDDPAEARRLLERFEFSAAQRHHFEGLIERWERERGRERERG